MNSSIYATQILDNRCRDCAAGFVRLLEMMEALASGETLAILSTDIASQHELSDWAARAGHTILKTEKAGPFWKREHHYLIRKENAKSI